MENLFSTISEGLGKFFKELVAIVTVIATALTGGIFGGNRLSDKTVKMVEIAGWYITDEEAETIEKGFAEIGKGLGDASEVEGKREIILSQTFTKDGKSAMVVYNFTDGKYYTVSGELYDIYVRDDNFRKLGAPVTNMSSYQISGSTTANTISSGKYKAQIFEKGVLLFDEGGVQMYVGAIEKNKSGYVIHPLIDDQDLMVMRDGKLDKLGNVDGEMHPLKEVIFSRTGNGYKLYANYSSCAVYLELGRDYSVKKQLISAAKNYIKTDKGYVATILPVECISVDDMIKDGADPVDPEALAYYQQKKPRGTADDIVAKFRTAYEDLYKEGFVPGYRCSKIKMWTYMVLDLRFGDGNTGFDEAGTNGRERMTCLVYNAEKDKVYPVSGTFFTIWKEDGDTGRNVLGCPKGKILRDENFAGVTYSQVQEYQNGTICLNNKGDYFVFNNEGECILNSAPLEIPDKNEEKPTETQPQQENTTKPQADEPEANTQSTATNAQIIEIAGYSLSDGEIKEIKEGYAAKGKGLGKGEDIEARREIVLTQIYRNDVTSHMVIYNFSEKNYYVVNGELIDAYLVDESFRKLGAPTSEIGTVKVSGSTAAGKIKSGDYRGQVFEKGVLLIDGDRIQMHIGAVEKREGSIVIHPIVDDQDIILNIEGEMKRLEGVDGEMHPLKEIEISSSSGGYKVYANYSSCAVYLELGKDYTIKKQRISAAKNYIGKQEKLLPMECINIDDMIKDGENPVTPEALDYYKQLKGGGTEEEIVAKFRSAYEELYKEGFVAGYRCSQIKMWTYMVLDLRFGDGTTGFDEEGSGGRERMTCLVYNGEKDKVFPVYGSYFLLWKEDGATGRNTLGYPESRILYDTEINGTKYKEIQLFKNGYIYLSDGGNYRAVTGAAMNSEGTTFLPSPTPMIPDRYGAELKRVTSGNTVYINYEKGAIRCDLSFNGAQYRYTFLNGRNFNLESGNFEVTLLPMDKLVDLSKLTSEGTMPTRNGKEVSYNDVIKPKLIAKYTELYNSGFFCGFPEEVFKGAWNNVFAQQFVVGDSSSMIFGEERPFVCALVYNPKTDAVYLMKDDVIKTWQSVYATAGSPTSDEYQVPGCDMWFQTFDFGMTMRNGNLIVFTEAFVSPEAYVEEMKANPLSAPTHGKKPENGYIG